MGRGLVRRRCVRPGRALRPLGGPGAPFAGGGQNQTGLAAADQLQVDIGQYPRIL